MHLDQKLVEHFKPQVLAAVASLPETDFGIGSALHTDFLSTVFTSPTVEYKEEKTFSIGPNCEPTINFKLYGDLEFFTGVCHGDIVFVRLFPDGSDELQLANLVAARETELKGRIASYNTDLESGLLQLWNVAASAFERRARVENWMRQKGIKKVDPPNADGEKPVGG